jgi:hypothetical protein
MNMCVRGIDLVSFFDFRIGFLELFRRYFDFIYHELIERRSAILLG